MDTALAPYQQVYVIAAALVIALLAFAAVGVFRR
jgi:hypothetical protein